MAAPPHPAHAANRPRVPQGAEWIVAPLPLVFALIALVLGPTDAREIAAEALYTLSFRLFLPALALLAGVRACWRPAAARGIDWRPGLALIAAAAGAFLGQVLLDPRTLASGSEVPGVTWVVGVALPLWATCLLTAPLRRWRALAWAVVPLLCAAAVAFGASLALHLYSLAAGNGLAAGGAIWTVLAIALARSTPAWLRSGRAVAVLGGLAQALPAAAIVIWLGTPPAIAHIPIYVHEPLLPEGALVEAYSPRTGVLRMLIVPLDGGPPIPLPRRTDQACSLGPGVHAVHLQRSGHNLELPLGSPRVGVQEQGVTRRLPGTAGGRLGLLRCSAEGEVMWVAGTTMDVWEPATSAHWHLQTDGEEVAFPCFTNPDRGVLYRLRGDGTPPYPRRFLPLVDGGTPQTGPVIDAARCNEGQDSGRELWFERPIPHSGVPWRVLDRTAGTEIEIPETILRIDYHATDLATALLEGPDGGTRVAIWRAGEGRIADWPAPPGNHIYTMDDGAEVLVVSRGEQDAPEGWRLYRAADGALMQEGTSSSVWPVEGRGLLELRERELVLHDLRHDGVELVLLPREEGSR